MAVNSAKTQRAWIIEGRGRPNDVLKLRTDWPVPTRKDLKPGHVLVKVQAAALNPVDYKLMEMLPDYLGSGRPLPAGYDFSGVVVDSNGTEFKEEDEVFGWISTDLAMKLRQGSLAEYLQVPADHIVSRPKNISPIEAAGVTAVAQTAYEGIFDFGQLEAGQTIFVNGGSSAVGAFAIQLAKAKGAKVVASTSAKNLEYVRKLGADEVIDYTKEPLHQYLTNNPPSPKFHVIYDAVGLVDPSLYIHSPAYLAPSGVFISTGPLPADLSLPQVTFLLRTIAYAYVIPSWLGGIDRKWKLHSMINKKKRLEEIRDMLARGIIRPLVDSVYEFDNVLAAYERMMSHRATGKIIVKVDPMVA